MNPAPVVIGYDGSPEADRTIREAAKLLGHRPAVVVHAWVLPMAQPTDSDFGTVVAGGPDVELLAEFASAATEVAERGAEIARHAGFAAEYETFEGEPAEALLEVAAQRDAAGVLVGP